MPNLDRLHPWVVEDELYVESLDQAVFSSLSVNSLYVLKWADSVFEDVYEFIDWLVENITEMGIPLNLSAANMVPSDQFLVGLRTGRSTDLFGKEWIRTGIAGTAGGDIYSPGDPTNLYSPDGNVDGFDWIAGANKTTVTIVTLLVIKFLGPYAMRFLSKSGKWVAQTIKEIGPHLRFHSISNDLDDIDSDIQRLFEQANANTETERLEIEKFLNDQKGIADAPNYGPAILNSLKKLGVALDTNSTSDYLQFRKFISQVDALDIGKI